MNNKLLVRKIFFISVIVLFLVFVFSNTDSTDVSFFWGLIKISMPAWLTYILCAGVGSLSTIAFLFIRSNKKKKKDDENEA